MEWPLAAPAGQPPELGRQVSVFGLRRRSRAGGSLLIEHGDAEICEKYPGGEEHLIVVVNEPLAFARWHLGELNWGDALRSGAIEVHGAPTPARALPTWNRRVGSPPPQPAAAATVN